MLKRLLYAIGLCLVLVACGSWLYQYNQVEKPVLVNTNGRVFQTAKVVAVTKDNIQENGARVGDQIVQLELTDGPGAGTVVEANAPNGLLFGTICRPGMHVVAINSHIGDLSIHTVYNVDRQWPIFLYILLFMALLSLIGGKRGFKAVIALIITFVLFIFLFFPMIFRGMPPVFAALITASLVLAITVYLISGWSRKSFIAAISTIGGLLIACFSAILFGHATNISGYNVANIENLIFVAQNTAIDVGQLLFAGILFASLGAVMDIAMDVSSACSEIAVQNPKIGKKGLFLAGMNVGRDVMGTMSTTLILAFFGSALGAWTLDYVYNLPYLQFINSNIIGIEIMKGFSASFGVILTVPVAAGLSALLHKQLEQVPTEASADCKILSKSIS